MPKSKDPFRKKAERLPKNYDKIKDQLSEEERDLVDLSYSKKGNALINPNKLVNSPESFESTKGKLVIKPEIASAVQQCYSTLYPNMSDDVLLAELLNCIEWMKSDPLNIFINEYAMLRGMGSIHLLALIKKTKDIRCLKAFDDISDITKMKIFKGALTKDLDSGFSKYSLNVLFGIKESPIEHDIKVTSDTSNPNKIKMLKDKLARLESTMVEDTVSLAPENTEVINAVVVGHDEGTQSADGCTTEL